MWTTTSSSFPWRDALIRRLEGRRTRLSGALRGASGAAGRLSSSVGGHYGLFGSGEFLPWAEPVDRWLASSGGGRGGRVLVLPTASAPEGDDVFGRWGSMGVSHYRKLGLEPA